MFSQQTGGDGGNQKRCVQLTCFSGDSVTKGLSPGKLWSKCRRDPEPHSQSSGSALPDAYSEEKVGRGAAGPESSAEEQMTGRKQQDKQSQALLAVRQSISKLACRETTTTEQPLCVSVCAREMCARAAALLLELGAFGKNESIAAC